MTVSRQKVLVTGLIGLLLALCAPSTIAAPIFYTDKSTFDSVTTTQTNDFNSTPGASGIALGDIHGNVYTTVGGAFTNVLICSVFGCAGQPFDSPLMVANQITSATDQVTLQIDLATPATAVGGLFGDLDGPAGGSAVIKVFGLVNNLLDTQNITVGSMGAGQPKTFFGWTTSGEPFTRVHFTLGGTPNLWGALDDFQFGTVNTSVPEPSILGLLGLGLLGLGVARRRRIKA